MKKEKTVKEQLLAKMEQISTYLSKSEPKSEAVKLAAEIVREDGVLIYTSADEFAVGVDAWVKDGEETVVAPDGEHKLEDGRVLIVAGGVVESINEVADDEELNDDAPVTRAEFTQTLKDLHEALGLQSQILSAIEFQATEDNKASEAIKTELAELKEAKEALETKLAATPAAKSVKESKGEKKALNLSKAQISELSTKDYIKLTREYPELLKN